MVESNTEYCFNITKDFIQEIKRERQLNSQVFTSMEIAKFMADMVILPSNTVSVLDPGAGTGMLLSAICDRIIKNYEKPIEVSITAYENDQEVIPYLKENLSYCESVLSKKKFKLNYQINTTDFFLECQNYLDQSKKHFQINQNFYDIIIANPPYQKIKSDFQHLNWFSPLLNGQTNEYVLFVVLSLSMLKNEGSFIFLTPRSFFSGPYHKKVRKWLLTNYCLNNIHLFKNRTGIFDFFNIRQEVIIWEGQKKEELKCSPIFISTSENEVQRLNTVIAPYKIVINNKTQARNIHIPETKQDMKVIDTVHSWENTLKDYGLRVSTGKIVHFRSLNFLDLNSDNIDTVPLLWMQHIQKNQLIWPLPNFKKPQKIKLCKESFNRLVPTKNYVLIRRFFSKDEKSRILSAPLFKTQFENFPYLGFENHLNYIYKEEGEMSILEVCGISAYLNSIIINRYYQTLSGTTQVNATDLNNMQFPSREKILKIGKFIQTGDFQRNDRERKIAKILNINSTIINSLLN